ncbi:MAG: sulfatase-like hydrolase/transferase [Planctomycetota bacterium]
MPPFHRALGTVLARLAAAAAIAAPLAAQTPLVQNGATWRYLDDGSDQGFAWRLPGFDDASWATGPAQLGYGEGDEATVVSFGRNPNRRHVTTYFRHSFTVGNPGAITQLCLRLVRDDGAVVYLNGTEIARSNVLVTPVLGHLTLATTESDGASAQTVFDFAPDPSLLVSGTNVLAVELHKHATASPTLSFDLALYDATATTCQSQPNLLVLIADDLGVDVVGAYGEGSNQAPTPNIDQLAAQGILFRNAWTNPECSPTRAAIHTGRHAMRTLVGSAIPIGNSGVLQLPETTLPEILDTAGGNYAHALIGKWHLGDERNGGDFGPNLAGWSHFAGLIPGALSNYYNWPRTVNGVTTTSTAYSTTQMVDDALSWIGGQDGPWLCVLSFNAPHGPYQPPPPSLHSQDLTGLSPGTTPRPFFRALVEAMDNEIGRLLTSLGGELARTDVIFMGDNGTDGNVTRTPFRAIHAKGTPYEGGVNVPLIVSGPSVTAPGREEGALVSAVDLVATLTELAGVDVTDVVPPWAPFDSVSFAPYLRNPSATPRRNTVFTESFNGETWTGVNTSGAAAIRDDTYKLIRFYTTESNTDEFYDLVADPFENSELLAAGLNPTQQAAYDALRQELEALRAPTGRLVTFGETWCVGRRGFVTVGGSGTPDLGATYQVLLSNGAPGSLAGLLTGSSATSAFGVALPLELQPFGAGPNCYLRTSLDFILPVTTDATGAASVDFPVPVDPGLVGATLFHSWVVVDAEAPFNPWGLTLSNGLGATIGSS